MSINSIKFSFKKHLHEDSKLFKYLKYSLILLFLLIVVFNVVNYDQTKAYDYDLIYWYIQGMPTQIPTPEQNPTYYHPPLPYFLPSLIDSLCDSIYESEDSKICDKYWHLGSGAFQAVLFFGSALIFFKIFKIINGNKKISEKSIFTFLLLFSMPTVSFKTFAMIRAEPYLVFLSAGLIYLVIKSLSTQQVDLRFFIKSGIITGLLLLVKQSSLFIFLGLIPSLFFLYRVSRLSIKKYTFYCLISIIFAFSIGGWFYLYQYDNYGSFGSIPRPKAEFSFENHIDGFYSDFDFNEVISSPIKYHKEAKLLQIMYVDIWGDYSGYYLWDRSFFDDAEYVESVNNNLSRLILFSFLPTFVYIIAFFSIFYESFKNAFSKKFLKQNYIILTLIFPIITVLFGYLYFITIYPYYTDGSYNVNGDTIKATYILPAINLISTVSAYYFSKIEKSKNNITSIILLVMYGFLILNIGNYFAKI
jgi:hypothetical protein